MNLNFDSIQISDLLNDTHWNFQMLQNLFGLILNDFTLNHGSVTYDHDNTWVWFPKSRGTKISTMVYSYLNQQLNMPDSWDGWSII